VLAMHSVGSYFLNTCCRSSITYCWCYARWCDEFNI